MYRIKDLEVKNELQYIYGLVGDLQERVTQKGDPYIAMKLYDKDSQITVRIWSTSMADLEEKGIKNSSLVKAGGKCDLYRDEKQFTVETQRQFMLRLAGEDDEIDLEDFIPMAPVSFNDIKTFILEAIENMEDEDYKSFIKEVFADYGDDLIKTPASVGVHHEYLNGLGYHIYRMLKSAIALAKVYEADYDILVIGVLTHDLGKLRSYVLNELGTPETYTVENDLLGHIPMGILMIEDYALPKEKKDLVRHMILSHHGSLEFGSPVTPVTIEAEILHAVDSIDANITIREREESALESGTMGKRVWSLDNSKVYKKPDFSEED